MIETPLPGRDRLVEFLGITWDDDETCRLAIRPEHLNAGGMLAGPVTYALVDYGMGVALWPHVGADEGMATVNIAINYVQTATEGELLCRTAMDRRNRRLATLRSEVTHAGDGRLVVTAVGSYTIFPRRGTTLPRAGSGGP